MSFDDNLTTRLLRLQKSLDRIDRALGKKSRQLEDLFLKAVQEAELEKKDKATFFEAEEARLRSLLDQAGKDYTQAKYRAERDSATTKAETQKIEADLREIDKKYSGELNRLNEEKVAFKVSHERQISALTDLYQEKMRHLNISKAGLVRESQLMASKVNETRGKCEAERTALEKEWNDKLALIKTNSDSKRIGWESALEGIRKELASLATEKNHLDQRLSTIRIDKEKELEAVRLSLSIAREQLEVDKATLIEKAEQDQRNCEADVLNLKVKIQAAERELSEFTTRHEQSKKDTEEGFQKEEEMLKEAVKTESEKRDYEQKLFEQEKGSKVKELNQLKEEYEKKKWQWDNQIRSLMMQKAVQDSEFEADRLRVDREARASFRSLEVKRDELRQRLAEIKNRYTANAGNAQKETELITQRWHWRRDRLWNLWQARLETLRKERGVLQEQIDGIMQKFDHDRQMMVDSESRESKRISETENFVLQTGEKNKGVRQQKEIQIELEKTRVLAQIKECETLLMEWSDRLKSVQMDVSKNNTGFIGQMNYLDRWFRDEEKETQLFLHTLQNGMSAIELALQHLGLRKAA